MTVRVNPKDRNNVNQGSLLLVTFMAGKEYIPPISIPTTINPDVYMGIFSSRDPGLYLCLFITPHISGSKKQGEAVLFAVRVHVIVRR